MIPYFRHFPIADLHLPHLNPVMGGAQQCGGGYSFGPVMRRYYILEYVLRGRGRYTTGGHTYAVGEGEAFIIKPFEAHLLVADETDPWAYVWVGFTTDLTLPGLLAENDVFDASFCADIFLRLADGNEKSRTAADYAAEIYGIFARCYAAESTAAQESADVIDRAVAIIRAEYATLTVQELAARLFLNRSYFGTLFKKKTGKTPKAYIDEVRLTTAAMMMSELGYTATQAALATGYGDVMCFSKMYKKHFGKPPRSSMQKRSPRGGTILLK